MRYSARLLTRLYTSMLRIRVCEESLVAPILNGDVRCPVHLYSGEEAVAVGVCAALKRTDRIFSTHRSHGHYLAKGGSLRELIAEIYGKVTGCSKGRGGSMHVIAPEHGMMGSAPIVGGTIALALGSALASRIRKDGGVTVSFFGDGATGEGTLYESLNFAALKRLPIVFVCENNLYSTHLPIGECRVGEQIYRVARPFCQSWRVDGNDVLAVHKAASDAVRLCRTGKGPVFLECLTYRLRGHVGPDDNVQGTHIDIRPSGEVARWKKKDPLRKLERHLVRNAVLREEQLEGLRRRIEKELAEAYRFAAVSAYPARGDIGRYVFSK